MRFLIVTCAWTDKGIRARNEDYFGSWTIGAGSRKFVLLAVADGLGGHPAGDVASRVAIDSLYNSVRNSFSVFSDNLPKDPRLIVRNGFQSAVSGVVAKQNTDPSLRGMGTTLTAALIDDNGDGVIAHAGDSRAYLISDSMHQITRDHSVVQEMADKGQIPQSQVSKHPLHNRLTRALGCPVVNPDEYVVTIGSGTLLLCTDGLIEGLTDEEILDISRTTPFSGTCQALVHEAKKKSRDNITTVMAKIRG
jgi:serine/threonine protein phosphatase PrpC